MSSFARNTPRETRAQMPAGASFREDSSESAAAPSPALRARRLLKEPLSLCVASLCVTHFFLPSAVGAPVGGPAGNAGGSEMLSRPAGTSLTPEATVQKPSVIPQENAPLVDGVTALPDGTTTLESGGHKDRDWKFFFSASVTGVFTDNYYLSSREKEKDFSVSFSPKVAVGRGDVSDRALSTFGFSSQDQSIDDDERGSFIFVSYAPSETLYLNHGSQNRFDHDAVLAGVLRHRKIELGVDARIQTLLTADDEADSRVERTVFDGRLVASYELTGKLSFESSIRSQVTSYRFSFTSYRVWSNENFLDYQTTALLRIGIGGGVGLAEPEGNAKQMFQQALIRASLKTTEKLSLNAKFGGEWRQVEDGQDSANPIFLGGFTYKFTERTRFSLEATRVAAVSVTNPRQNYVVSFVSGGLQQQVTPHLELGLFAGYFHRKFEENFSNESFEGNFDRTEDIFYIRPEIGFTLGRFARCDFSYEFRNKDSSDEDHTFTENTATVTVEFLF